MFYITRVYMILLLFLAVSILQCQISPHKRDQVVTNCSVLYALLNCMKTTSLIVVYLVEIF